MANNLFHPHPQTFVLESRVHDGELGRDGIWDGDGDGPTVALEKGCSCRQARPLQSVEVPARGAIPGPSLDLLDLQADQSSGLAHLSSGHLFFLVALCNNPLSLFAPLSQFRPTSSGDWRRRHRHRHRRRSFHLHFSNHHLDILLLILLHTYIVPADHLPRCLGPSFRPTSAIQSVASSSSSEQVSAQTRPTRSVCPEPSHRLHLPDSSACGRVA